MTRRTFDSGKLLKIEEIRIKLIEILLVYNQFCLEHNLKYYLCGGTLLGAIRHEGFIPWDDDIDVCMPRDDYEYFINNFRDNDNIELITCQNKKFINPYSRLVDKDILLDFEYYEFGYCNNLWIDILPVDGMSEDLKEVDKNLKKCKFYRRMIGVGQSKLGEGSNVFKKICKYLLKPIINLYGLERISNRINNISKKYNYNSSYYVGITACGEYGIGERMIKKEFEKKVLVNFEGHKFPAMSCWNSYLSGIYGDYMKLPPIESRKTHKFVAYYGIKEECNL